MNGREVQAAETDIAIIGMAGRFPGADDLDSLWRLLSEGREGVTRFSREELAAAGVPARLLDDPGYVPAHGIIPDVDLFDTGYFEFTPAEAAITDPQHRILLTAGHAALENAGYDPGRYDGLISVYAGAAINTYLQQQVLPNVDQTATSDHFAVMVGNDKDFLATRLSYKLDLKGPGYAVQTACSTSLVAIHLACQGLINDECDMALAGGVTVKLPQAKGHLRKHPDLSSADVAKTLGAGRRAHRHRCAVVCSDLREAALALALADREQLITGEAADDRPDVVYAVADRLGDGGAHAVALLRALPVYRAELRALTGEGPEALVGSDDTRAALVAQLAAARLFTTWGVRPAAVTGGPVARLVGACLSGALTVPEALSLLDTDPATWTGVPQTPADAPADALLLRLQPDGTAPIGLHRTAHDLATVWTAGADVDWEAFYGGEQRCRVPLPHYPFEHKRHWVEPDHRTAQRTQESDTLTEQLGAAVGYERVDILTEFVQHEIARVLGTEAERLPEVDRNLFDMGLDSLILIDITARLGDALGERVEASAFIEYPTIRSFTEHLAVVLGLVEKPAPQQDDGRTSRRAAMRRARS